MVSCYPDLPTTLNSVVGLGESDCQRDLRFFVSVAIFQQLSALYLAEIANSGPIGHGREILCFLLSDRT